MCRRIRFWGAIAIVCGICLILSNFIQSAFLCVSMGVLLIAVGMIAWKQ